MTPLATVEGVPRLTSKEAAERAGITVRSLYELVRRGTFPPADGRLGRTLWWNQTTVDKWKRSRRRPGRPPVKPD